LIVFSGAARKAHGQRGDDQATKYESEHFFHIRYPYGGIFKIGAISISYKCSNVQPQLKIIHAVGDMSILFIDKRGKIGYNKARMMRSTRRGKEKESRYETEKMALHEPGAFDAGTVGCRL
jgi:hypothetical protein